MDVLGVNVHWQCQPGWCGLACAQMVDAYLNGGSNQEVTFRQGQFAEPWSSVNFATTKYQLEQMINWASERAGMNTEYRWQALDTVRKAIDLARKCVEEKRMPAVVLVEGGNHWVVVDGFEDDGGVIKAHVVDPMPPKSTSYPKDDHGPGCGCHPSDLRDAVKTAEEYFTPCASDPASKESQCGDCEGKWVVVVVAEVLSPVG